MIGCNWLKLFQHLHIFRTANNYANEPETTLNVRAAKIQQNCFISVFISSFISVSSQLPLNSKLTQILSLLTVYFYSYWSNLAAIDSHLQKLRPMGFTEAANSGRKIVLFSRLQQLHALSLAMINFAVPRSVSTSCFRLHDAAARQTSRCPRRPTGRQNSTPSTAVHCGTPSNTVPSTLSLDAASRTSSITDEQ